MNKFEEYSKFVDEIKSREVYKNTVLSPNGADFVHAAIGASTETGELLEAIRLLVFYKKALDSGSIIEELGDIIWYLVLAMNCMNTSIEEVLDANTDRDNGVPIEKDECAKLFNAVTGASIEANKILDTAKKLLVYNKPLDRDDIIE